MVITLEEGGGWIGWWLFSFLNLKYVNGRDNYMQVYNKKNIKTIVYKVKE